MNELRWYRCWEDTGVAIFVEGRSEEEAKEQAELIVAEDRYPEIAIVCVECLDD